MIAILGATGYLGRSLGRLLAEEGRPVTLFARDLRKLSNQSWPAQVRLGELADFRAADFGLVVNAIGAGDPARVKSMGSAIVDVTTTWDLRVLSTMAARTRYVFLSSGAVYSSFDQPGTASARSGRPVELTDTVPAYTAAKLQAELRHRAAQAHPILDLRIFGYADPTLDLEGTFFLSELALAVLNEAVFVTSRDDMVRDYAGVKELRALIDRWETANAPNCALDLYTTAPASKHDILKAFAARYGLRTDYAAGVGPARLAPRQFYASHYHAAAEFGFKPERDTIRVLTDTVDAIISSRR